MKQAISNPYTFEGIVANLGAVSQTTHINVNVYNASGNNVFSTTSADSVLTPQDTIIFVGQDKFTPTTEDEYYFETWASSIDTVSDTMYSSSIVSEKVYARDNGTDHSEYGLGRSCGGMIIGTYFDVYDTDDLASLSVFMKDNSVVGADIFAVLYEIDASNEKIYLIQSDDYSLTSNDIGNWVTIPLDDDFTLVPGTYMAAVGSYANPIDTSVLAMSQYTEAATCYIQKNGCLNTGQTFGSWYWTSRVPMVRMNFATVSAIKENIFDGEVSIYPNPSSDFIRIDMMDVNRSEYNVSIINILGEKVFDISESISGNYMQQIDVRNLANGTYILQITNEETIFFEKIIIE